MKLHPAPGSLTACVMIFGSLVAAAAARDPELSWFEHTAANAWLQNYDPTLISRRLYGEISYESDAGGQSTTEFSWSARGAITIREDLAFGYQVGWPVKWIDNGTERISGQADLETRIGLVGRLSPTLRWGTGLNAKYNTAAEPGLGDEVFQLRPILAMRWNPVERVSLGINLEYTFTPRDEDTQDLSYLELKLPIAVHLGADWSAEVAYKPRWNFLSDDDRHRLTLTATRNWGPAHRYAWSIGTELPLSSQTLDWKVVSGVSWAF